MERATGYSPSATGASFTAAYFRPAPQAMMRARATGKALRFVGTIPLPSCGYGGRGGSE
jgi:hypothetical protein